MDISNIIASVITGVLASIVFPLVSSWVDREKDTKHYRRERMKEWRSFFESDRYIQNEINNAGVYAEIRPYLSKRTIDGIEGRMVTIAQGRGGDLVKSQILDDLTALEKEWKLLDK